jgi:hypothetical protein
MDRWTRSNPHPPVSVFVLNSAFDGLLKNGVARRAVAADRLHAVAIGAGLVGPEHATTNPTVSAQPTAAWRCIRRSDAKPSCARLLCHTFGVTRRLRLTLLLAALAVAGPMPPVRAVDAGRLDVSIAWFRSERTVSPSPQHSNPALPDAVVARRGFNAHPAPLLAAALLSHSLFQRPPPLQN